MQLHVESGGMGREAAAVAAPAPAADDGGREFIMREEEEADGMDVEVMMRGD
jgi:hypothetical protein